MKHRTWIQLATLSGLIPFVALGTTLCLGQPQIYQETLRLMFLSYSAIILSFVCGVHFMMGVIEPTATGKCMFSSALLYSLVGWASVWSPVYATSLLLLIACFLGHMAIDYKLGKFAIMPSWFRQLKLLTTSIVVLILVVVLTGALL